LAHQQVEPKASPRDALTFTLQGASAHSGLSISTIRRLNKDGKLQFVRVRGRTLVVGDSLRRMLNQQVDQ
jgi:hypothetical protein